MSKENKFSIFIGLAFLMICIIIVILALMSAIKRNENIDNVIYIDDNTGTVFSIPKSSIISEYVNLQKDIQGQNGILHIDVKLPKINIDSDNTNIINKKIYEKYQNLYNYATKIDGNESISINYSYEYITNKHKLVITIVETKINKEKEKMSEEVKYTYDILNDSYN